jgi:hypothetical protein
LTGASCIAGPRIVSITPQVFDLLHYLIRNRECAEGNGTFASSNGFDT